MKKIIFLFGASLLAIWAGNAYAAGWEPVPLCGPGSATGTPCPTATTYEAEFAGKSGNVKACFQTTTTYVTVQWQHQAGDTLKTRGTEVIADTGEQIQVADSLCEPQ